MSYYINLIKQNQYITFYLIYFIKLKIYLNNTKKQNNIQMPSIRSWNSLSKSFYLLFNSIYFFLKMKRLVVIFIVLPRFNKVTCNSKSDTYWKSSVVCIKARECNSVWLFFKVWWVIIQFKIQNIIF